MRKLLCLLLSVALLLSICACGSDDINLSGASNTLEILLNDEDVLCLQVPVELSIVKRDNIHYWEFTSNVGIYRMTSLQTTAKLDEETGLYLSSTAVIRNFDDCCVVINCSGTLQEYFKNALMSATIKQKDSKPYKELEITRLPSYAEKTDMELQNDMYMPPNCEDVLYDIYASRLYTQGADWLQSIIMDAKLEDLRPMLLTLATMNSGTDRVTKWYESDDIFYCETAHCVVGAKKLAFNSWYVYQGSVSMQDYILTGIEKVHG